MRLLLLLPAVALVACTTVAGQPVQDSGSDSDSRLKHADHGDHGKSSYNDHCHLGSRVLTPEQCDALCKEQNNQGGTCRNGSCFCQKLAKEPKEPKDE